MAPKSKTERKDPAPCPFGDFEAPADLSRDKRREAMKKHYQDSGHTPKRGPEPDNGKAVVYPESAGKVTDPEEREAAEEAAKEARTDLDLDEEEDKRLSKELSARTGANVTVEGASKAIKHHAQTLIAEIACRKVKRKVQVEVYKHKASGLYFSRKAVPKDKTDALKDKEKTKEERTLRVFKGLKSEEGNEGLQAAAEAGDLWKIAEQVLDFINSRDGKAVKEFPHELVYFDFMAGPYVIPLSETALDTFITKLKPRLGHQGRKGDGTSMEAAQEIVEAAKGELRSFIQHRMKLHKDYLTDGRIFEACMAAFYAWFKREIAPDDDEDPGANAPLESWLTQALPDRHTTAST